MKFVSPVSAAGLPKLSVHNFHLFGCECWYHVSRPSNSLVPHARQGILLTYLKENLGAYVYGLASGKCVKTTSVKCFDDTFPGLSTVASPRVAGIPVSRVKPLLLPWPEFPAYCDTVPDSVMDK